jgi:hypothetical protein
VLLAWEIGGGRGHILMLRLAAAALARGNFTCTAAALLHLEHAGEIAPYVERIRQAPWLRFFESLRWERGQRPAATYADWLGDHGLFSADLVLQQMLAWKDIFEEEEPDLVIGEQSPVAMLTARAMGIACAGVGIGYTLPAPELTRYPVIFAEHTEPLWSEDQMTEAVNAALAHFGSLRISRLPQVYECDAKIVCTPAMFDPFADARSTPLLPPNLPPVDVVERHGDEVFIYLSTGDRENPVILAAIATLRLPKRMFVPSFNPTMVKPMEEYGIKVEKAPLPPPEIAKRARVMLHAANHGMASLCLRAGVPFVGIPQQQEQAFNAMRAEEAGLARAIKSSAVTVPNIHKAVHELYESDSIRHNAIALARSVAPQFDGDPSEILFERIEAIFR